MIRNAWLLYQLPAYIVDPMLWIIRDALEMLRPRAEILRLRLVHCFVGEVFFQASKRLYHAKMSTNSFLEYITNSMFIF